MVSFKKFHSVYFSHYKVTVMYVIIRWIYGIHNITASDGFVFGHNISGAQCSSCSLDSTKRAFETRFRCAGRWTSMSAVLSLFQSKKIHIPLGWKYTVLLCNGSSSVDMVMATYILFLGNRFNHMANTICKI